MTVKIIFRFYCVNKKVLWAIGHVTKFAQIWLSNLKNLDKIKVNKNKKKFEVILTKQALLIKDL